MNLWNAAKGMLEAYEKEPYFSLNNDEVVLGIDGEGKDMKQVAYILGSNDFTDWCYNCEAIPWLYNNQFYHKGFLRSVKILLPAIEKMGVSLIVGHSRGAAVASIISRITKIPSIAFNCPRPLWFGRRKLQIPCICVQAMDDPICNMPTKYLGYQHAGTCLWFPGKGIDFKEDHRIRHMIDTLDNNIFGQMSPFTVRNVGEATGKVDISPLADSTYIPRLTDDSDC